MARVIEFYTPENYQPKPKPAVVSITRGKVIEFPIAHQAIRLSSNNFLELGESLASEEVMHKAEVTQFGRPHKWHSAW